MRLTRLCAVILILATCVIGCSSKRQQNTSGPNAPSASVCQNPPASLAGYGPGDVIASEEVQITSNLTGAKAWRMLYVSTSVDETALVPVCALVVAPDKPAKIATANETGKLATWAHGTIGIAPQCQPSNNPSKLWGTTPGGINIVNYGSVTSLDKNQGQPAGGILQHMIDEGWIVTATDYWQGLGTYRLQPYVVGVTAAANVLDSARAGTALVAQQYPSAHPKRYDFITWGHSQGGHASLWAGQLARKYLQATAPRKTANPAELRLVGVVGEAPASNFVAAAGAPQATWGTHLGDREMHQVVDAKIFDITVDKLAIGPVLFSYVGEAWQQMSTLTPAPSAQFPAYSPEAGGDLDLDAFLTPQGSQTANSAQNLCLNNKSDAKELSGLVSPYLQPAQNSFFVPSIWGQPGPDGQYVGELDRSCAAPGSPGLAKWCAWLRWNEPGPIGTSHFEKFPMFADGTPVPLYIAHGENDNVVHCMYSGDGVAPAADCLSKQLFDQYSTAYCPVGNGGPALGYLQLDLWKLEEPKSPAQHLTIPGQAANNGQLEFVGSPLEKFMTQAMMDPKGFSPGCNARLING